MPPRKLLVVSDEMEIGGSQRQITYLLSGLDRKQWQPELVFFRNESFLVEELRAQGITVHHVPKRGRLDPGFLLAYSRFLRRQRYDLVHAFSLTAELWTLLAGALTLRRLPLVASVRGLYLAESENFWRLKRLVISRSAAVIANARAGAAAAAQRAGIALSGIDVVPNGLPPPTPLEAGQREVIRHTLGVPADRPFGLFVGRLVKEKNLACLIRALADIPASRRPWIALAGDGPLREDIGAMCETAGLHADVRLIGERNDAPSLMQAADFLILPSSYEGMSNVLMEAMAAGCPVLASDVGGNPELIDDGRTGLLFPGDDAGALAERLLALSEDTALRQRLSSQASETARQRYSVAQMIESTTDVYMRCLDRQATPAMNAAAIPNRAGDDA